MKPDESYIKLQKRLLKLIEINDRSGERTKIKKQLEKKFMAAWQFTPERGRRGSKLAAAIRLFKTEAENIVRGFDHCTHYTGENDQRIIVTQPYGVFPAEIVQDLTLSKDVCPEVIDATEWAFYYPEHARLFIVKFPSDFQKAMQKFEKELHRAKIDKFIKTQGPKSDYCDVGEMA
ncbi:MAG TPA: hypothetical protein VG347_16420 [Verrucomicrobiae bacterium]|nr:hypothetical protein [Verrucomicrobiae bacterium]